MGAGGWACWSGETELNGESACLPQLGFGGRVFSEGEQRAQSFRGGRKFGESVPGATGGKRSPILIGLWVGRGQLRGVTECQESSHLTPGILTQMPTPILQEQTTQVGDETAVTGECGWVQPPDLACTMPCRMDSDRGMKQRPLQTQVTKWSLFFFLF